MRWPDLVGALVQYEYHDSMRGEVASRGTVVQVVECSHYGHPSCMVLVADDRDCAVRLATAILSREDDGARTAV